MEDADGDTIYGRSLFLAFGVVTPCLDLQRCDENPGGVRELCEDGLTSDYTLDFVPTASLDCCDAAGS